MRSRFAFFKNAFCNSRTFLAKFGAEGAIDDDIDGRVNDLKLKGRQVEHLNKI